MSIESCKLCQQIGIKTFGELRRFLKEERQEDERLLIAWCGTISPLVVVRLKLCTLRLVKKIYTRGIYSPWWNDARYKI